VPEAQSPSCAQLKPVPREPDIRERRLVGKCPVRSVEYPERDTEPMDRAPWGFSVVGLARLRGIGKSSSSKLDDVWTNISNDQFYDLS
jgi:hypothetical protein